MGDGSSAPRLFLVTYRPLVCTPFGRNASAAHDIPPFVDGSIRREPDLAHAMPAISCLCRTDKFAPRLAVGDHVIYLTTKGRYGSSAERHWRLTAHLRVVHLFDGHADAAQWYRARGLALPNNCVVPGNDAMPLSHSSMIGRSKYLDAAGGICATACAGTAPAGGCGDATERDRCDRPSGATPPSDVHATWDAAYQRRAKTYGRFVACEPLFVDLSWEAPIVHEADLVHAFGYVPGTRNPGALPIDSADRLMRRLGLVASPCAH